MTETEWRAFIAEGTRTGKLAVVTPAGRPHVTPVWFVLDGDDVVFTTGETSLKGKGLLHTKRASLCVDDETPPYAYVTLAGTVSTSDDLGEMQKWSTLIGERYMGPDRAEEYGARNAAPTELLVRLTPTKVVGRAGVAD